jgi:23S rRNA (guanosine2251-2'-O)-methyltransferase
MTPIILILGDIRSTHNVGSILRSADCFGVTKILFAGYTPYPIIPNDERLPHLVNKITTSIHKTALGAENNIEIKVFEDTASAIASAKSDGYLVVALEQSPNSTPLGEFKFDHPLALLLGNEVHGLTRQTLDSCDMIIEIPQYGKKESLNVATAAAIALYALRAKN